MKRLFYLALLISPPLPAADVLPGSRVILTATAEGEPAPTYTWKKDGVLIPGATSATYVIASAGPEHAGSYVAVATNVAGRAESAPEVITVIRTTAPTNPRITVEVIPPAP